MSDVRFTYDLVYTVSSRLNQVTADTVPELAALQNKVNNLLTTGGGLWLRLSSPTLNEKYIEFNRSVTQAVLSIPGWAHQFENIVSAVKDLDRAITENANAK